MGNAAGLHAGRCSAGALVYQDDCAGALPLLSPAIRAEAGAHPVHRTLRCLSPESLMHTVGDLSRWHSSVQGCADSGACMGQLAGWAQRASQRASVLDSEVAPPGSQDYRAALLQHYSRYADASANSTSARDFK